MHSALVERHRGRKMWPDPRGSGEAASANEWPCQHASALGLWFEYAALAWPCSQNGHFFVCCSFIRERSPSLWTLKLLTTLLWRHHRDFQPLLVSFPHSKPFCWSSNAFTSWGTTRHRWRQLVCPSLSEGIGLCPAHSPRPPQPPSQCPCRSHPLSQGSQQVTFLSTRGCNGGAVVNVLPFVVLFCSAPAKPPVWGLCLSCVWGLHNILSSLSIRFSHLTPCCPACLFPRGTDTLQSRQKITCRNQ